MCRHYRLLSNVKARGRLFSTAQSDAVLVPDRITSTLLAIQILHTKFPTTSTVKLAEWVAHATRLCAPKLRVESLQPFQIGIKRRDFVCQSDK